MGGDHAPSVIVDGAVAAARHLDAEDRPRRADRRRRAALGAHADWRSLGIAIVDAPDVIEMTESPAAALRRKPRASIRVAAELVAQGEAAALVSAGHTGATVMAGARRVRHDPGVDRPALATTIPTRSASGGAARRRRHRRVPAAASAAVRRDGSGLRAGRARRRAAARRAAVDRRGGDQGQRADARGAPAAEGGAAATSSATSKGARSTAASADVIVCDGFTGNVVLKTSEGLVETVEALLGDELQGTFSSQVGYLLSRRAFRRFRRRVDYSEYGGAPLLGVGGLVDRRPRPLVGEGGAQRDRDGLPVRHERLHSSRRAGDRLAH